MSERVRPYLFYDVAVSICSTCLRRVEGKIVLEGDHVFLLKDCPDHGHERVLIADKPIPEGFFEAELYALPPENYYLPPIEFTDGELAALQTSLSLLDGEFAYAEPLRLALQQITWGRPSPLNSPGHQGVALGVTGSAGGHELSARLAKIETAIFRNKTITFEYYSLERDAHGARKVDPYHLLSTHQTFIAQALREGWKAVRISMDMSWLTKDVATPEQILKYEAASDAVFTFQNAPIIALMHYDYAQLPGALVVELLKLHPIAVVGKFIKRNPYYLNSEQYLLKILRVNRDKNRIAAVSMPG
jgi:hypothetical protein